MKINKLAAIGAFVLVNTSTAFAGPGNVKSTLPDLAPVDYTLDCEALYTQCINNITVNAFDPAFQTAYDACNHDRDVCYALNNPTTPISGF